MESKQEYADISAQEYSSDLNSLRNEINLNLPQGVEILEIRKLAQEEKAIAQATKGFEYELQLPAATESSRLMNMEQSIKNFSDASVFNIQKVSKGKTVIKDIRPFVKTITLDSTGKIIKFAVSHIQEGSARPTDIITHVLKSDADESRQIRVIKTKTILS